MVGTVIEGVGTLRGGRATCPSAVTMETLTKEDETADHCASATKVYNFDFTYGRSSSGVVSGADMVSSTVVANVVVFSGSTFDTTLGFTGRCL